MRADRLLSLLMLLQVHGKLPARRLAIELEVSERTIYRDIDALSAAGVPVYGEPGPEGGYALLDSYRTTLTGLSAAEMRALFMLSIPAPLAELGVGQELKAALLKVSAALPASQRDDERRVRQRFYLDSVGWEQREDVVPHLQAVHQAVWQDCRLAIAYRIGPLAVDVAQVVDPYGLVAKAGVWYLVYGSKGALRVHRIADLLNAQLTGENFARPAGFDLAAFWQEWCAGQESARSFYPVTLRVAPDFLPALPRYFGNRIHSRIAQASQPDAAGWVTLDLAFESLEAARSRLLSFGGGVEVLAPRALRESLVDFAVQIVALYGETAPI